MATCRIRLEIVHKYPTAPCVIFLIMELILTVPTTLTTPALNVFPLMLLVKWEIAFSAVFQLSIALLVPKTLMESWNAPSVNNNIIWILSQKCNVFHASPQFHSASNALAVNLDLFLVLFVKKNIMPVTLEYALFVQKELRTVNIALKTFNLNLVWLVNLASMPITLKTLPIASHALPK